MTRAGERALLGAQLARLEQQAATERREVAFRLRYLVGNRRRAGLRPLATALLLRKALALGAAVRYLPRPLRTVLLVRVGVAVLRRISRRVFAGPR